MKKYLFCLLILIINLFFSSCDRVVATPSDELFLTDRVAETASGIKATLRFFDGEGELKIEFPTGEEPVTIRGTVTADTDKFYITSREFGKTYIFSYEVYTDRAEITYNSQTLVFYPVKSATQTE